jgi:hypothetical protein
MTCLYGVKPYHCSNQNIHGIVQIGNADHPLKKQTLAWCWRYTQILPWAQAYLI